MNINEWKAPGTRATPAHAQASVNTFLQKMYYSISESMPTGRLGNLAKLYFPACQATVFLNNVFLAILI